MPLSPPVPREHLHNRDIQCRGYHRDDGLWDIEGRIVDTKTYDLDTEFRKKITAGEPVHDMWIRLTLDDHYLIVEVDAATDHAPFPICGEVAPNFQGLKGLRVGPGWRRGVREVLGGTKGCTHMNELLPVMATVAFQCIGTGSRFRKEQAEESRKQRTAAMKKFIINSCHGWADDGPAVKALMPDVYKGE